MKSINKNMDDNEIIKKLNIDQKTLDRFKEIRQQTIEEAKTLKKKNSTIKALGISGSARDQFDTAAEDSNSEFLLGVCLDELKKLGADVEMLKLRKCNIKYCKACYSTTNTQCHFPCSCYPKNTEAGDDMSNFIYDKLLAADIIIFATPVNNFKMSSLMALFLDRCISLDGSLSPADPKAPKNKDLNIKHTEFVELNADQKIGGSGFLRRFSGKVAGAIVTGHEEGAALVISSLFMAFNHFGMVFPPWSNMYAMSSITRPTFKDKKVVNGQVHCENAKKIAQNSFFMAKNLNGNQVDWSYDFSSN